MNAPQEHATWGGSARRAVKSFVWLAAAGWTALCCALLANDLAKSSQLPSAQLTASAASVGVFILAGFVIAYAITATMGD